MSDLLDRRRKSSGLTEKAQTSRECGKMLWTLLGSGL